MIIYFENLDYNIFEYKWNGTTWVNKKEKSPETYIGFYENKSINPFIYLDDEIFFGWEIKNWNGNFV